MIKVPGAKKQQGIALFQVLLMVSIMGILLLAAGQYANRTVEQTRKLERATHQRLALQSTHNWLEYQMAVQRWVGTDSLQQSLKLNFYGQPFFLELPDRAAYKSVRFEVEATIQNQRSLIDIRRADDGQLLQLMESFGVTPERGTYLVESLRIAQQPWRYGQAVLAMDGQQRFLQLTTIAELASIDGWEVQLIDQIEPFLTVHGARLNIHMAPQQLLNILLTTGQAGIVSANRQTIAIADESANTETAVSLQSSPTREQHIQLRTHDEITSERLVLVRPRAQVPIVRHNNIY